MPPHKAKAKVRVRAAALKAAAAKPVTPSFGKMIIPLKALSEILMLTPQRVNQIERDGWIPKTARNEYALLPAIQGYLKFLKDHERRSSKSAEAARVQNARAVEIELRNARAAGQLYDAEDVEAVFADVLGTYRSELSGVAAASTRDLTQRAIIEKHLNGAIDRCRERFEKASQDLRSGREVVLEGEEG